MTPSAPKSQKMRHCPLLFVSDTIMPVVSQHALNSHCVRTAYSLDAETATVVIKLSEAEFCVEIVVIVEDRMSALGNRMDITQSRAAYDLSKILHVRKYYGRSKY